MIELRVVMVDPSHVLQYRCHSEAPWTTVRPVMWARLSAEEQKEIRDTARGNGFQFLEPNR